MARNPKPSKNAELDKRIARRQAKLDAYVDRYNDILEKRAIKYAQEIAPFWRRAGDRISKEMARIVGELQDAQAVPIRGRISDAKRRNMDRAFDHLNQLLHYVREAEQTGRLTNNLAYTYTESYYYHAFGLQQAAQVAVTAPVISYSQVMGVLANPWLPDGNTYSDRIRANTTYLALKMRKAVEEAIQKGQEINRVARNIQAIAQEGYYNAVRLARTELNRAASQASSHLFMQNADLLEGKRWNATLDSRTAPKDAANDGKIYDLAYDTPEMPGRPGERIPNHPNCRCKYSPVLASLGVRERTRIARGDGDTPTSFGERTFTKARTFREYAKLRGIDLDERLRNDDPRRYLRNDERRNLPAATRSAITSVTSATAATWAEPVKQLVTTGVDTENKAREVGDLVRQEVEKRVSAQSPVLQRQVDTLKAEADALHKQIEDLQKEFWRLWGTDENTQRLKELEALLDKLMPELAEKRLQYSAAKQSLKTLRGEQVVKALSEVRPMGSTESHTWAKGSQKKAKEAIARAQRYYPTEWLEKSHSFNILDAKVVSRGYYRGGSRISEFRLSGHTPDQLTRVAIHEFGHRMEHVMPELRKLEKQFYDRRTKGESLQWLGPPYGKNEVTRFDKFLDPYMGKDYGNTETSFFEIFSMGAEAIFTGSYPIETDPDYYNFILGVLASL